MLTQRHYALPFALGEEAFGQFKIRDLLGQGPLGVVYKVTDERGNISALKVIHTRWREEMDLDTLQGTYLSVEDLKGKERLNLPVKILIHDEQAGLLSNLLSGLTVRKLMNLRKMTSKAFRLDELKQLVEGVASALNPLHREGVPHGGLKPENFFVTTDEDQQQVIFLSDARLGSGVGIENYHRAQRAAGHAHYLAPELGDGQVYLSSDVYSLGAFVFEGITGHTYQSKKNIRELIPVQGIEALESLLNRALHPDPDQRYRDVDAFLSAFHDVVEILNQLEGSPFNTEGTQPRNESMVARFDLTEGATTQSRLDDPLFGRSSDQLSSPPPLPMTGVDVGTPPPLPRTSGLHLGAFPINETPPPQFDFGVTQPSGVDEPSLDTLEALKTSEPIQLSLELGAPQRLSQSAVQRPQPSQELPWVSHLLRLAVVIGVAGSVYLFLNDDPSTGGEGVAVLSGQSYTDIDRNKQDSELKSTLATVSTNEEVSAVDETAADKAAADKAAADKAAADKAAADKAAADEAAADKAAADKAAADKAAADKAAADKAAADKAAADKAAADKAAADKAAADKAAARDKAAADKAAADKAAARDKAAADKAAADKAAADKAAADKAAADKAAADKAAADKAAADKAARDKAAADKAAADKAAADKAAADKAARDKAAADKAARDKTNPSAQASALKQVEETPKTPVKVPEKVQIDTGDSVLSCPTGMLLLTTKRFPSGSIKGGKIKGKRATAMAREGHAYCIDAYEYPGRGQKPKVNVTLAGAQSLCERLNKRLCTDNEWVQACSGSRGGKYPYGKSFNPSKCVTEDQEEEERKLSPSGSMRTCKSASGAYDMSGNASEWTSGARVRGGFYASVDEEASCSAGGRRSPSSQRAYIGFRCCADFKSR